MAENTLLSILNTQSTKNEILFYLQEDDTSLNAYVSMFESHNHFDFYIGPKLSTPIMWNILAEKASNDYLTLLADDVIIHTKGWDVRMDKKLSTITDNIFVAGASELDPITAINNDNPHWSITCHPIIPRRVFELLGYFIPLAFQHSIVDVWTSYMATCLGRFIMFNTIYFEHLMKTKGYRQDSTRVIVEAAGSRDFYTWNRTKRWWRADVDLLNRSMDAPIADERIDEYVQNMVGHKWWDQKRENWSVKKYNEKF
tara:strand:- start:1145 stop:1912 length:768 start_codon:yes stop_codon:yes gene_type:complete